ncbi:unnamed protein product, partial [Choristocarpus tenellus]
MGIDEEARRARITAVNNDAKLTQSEKSRMLFEIMNPCRDTEGKSEEPLPTGPYVGKMGCKVWETESRYTSCRLCHEYDRFAVKFMKCKACLVSQEAGPSCQNPECYKFGQKHWYYCGNCHLWEDAEKDIFHCDKCGICRTGDPKLYRHCDRCSLCVLKEGEHRCSMSSKDCCCPVCMEPLFDSR